MCEVVSIRNCRLELLSPIDCFDIALCSVFFVAWLWLGNGMTEAQTPKIREGCISQCVYFISLLPR
jgi:hypothetical protein